MIYIADYFAIGLVIIMFIFFWDTKTKFRNMPVSGKVFGLILTLTALNALIDLLCGVQCVQAVLQLNHAAIVQFDVHGVSLLL